VKPVENPSSPPFAKGGFGEINEFQLSKGCMAKNDVSNRDKSGNSGRPKILIVYASAGAGHQCVAESVYEALEKKGVELVDVLNFTPLLFRKLYPASYLFLAQYLPSVWGFLYNISDKSAFLRLPKKTRRFFNKINTAKFEKYLLETKPETVIATHCLPSEIVSHLKGRSRFSGRLITVITDFAIHSFLVLQEVDLFIVALESTRKELSGKGIAKERIKPLGIPIKPKFSVSHARSALLEKLGLEDNLFTILVASGGFGVGPFKQLIMVLEKLTRPVQVIIVCGQNKRLFKQLKHRVFKKAVRVYGFVENMDELMEVSHLIIGKAGGVTMAESLAKKLPSILISPIPGQETGNCDILEKAGCAVKVSGINKVKNLIEHLIDSPEELVKMKEQIEKTARPDSAARLAKLVEEAS